jgi:pimeloyl-ACP methyl ester carboxylesterase
MTGPITRHRDIESLKTAARWPGADRNTTVILATRLAAARADGEGYRTDLARPFSHAELHVFEDASHWPQADQPLTTRQILKGHPVTAVCLRGRAVQPAGPSELEPIQP